MVTRSRRIKRIAPAVILATLAVLFSVPTSSVAATRDSSVAFKPQGAAANHQTYLVYGDSLTWESAAYVRARLGSDVAVHSFPATAPCLWDTWLPQDLATYHPTVVAIISAGNACPGQTIGSLAYYFEYENDLNTFFSTVTSTGAKVVFFEAPPMLDPDREIAVSELPDFVQALATNYPGVTVSTDVFNALSSNGGYASTLPCLPSEGLAEGCVRHSITVRTTDGTQSGLHLCPGGLPSAFPWYCPTYSSGEFRFAKAVAAGLRGA
jgi:hypothetical protein